MISIIVLTFNRYELLLQCIDSILKQTYPDFEVLIVNDGSTDQTADLKDVLQDKRIRIFDLEKQNNLAKLRNFGIDKSTGEFIAFCDDDDMWIENKLEIQMEYLNRYDFICTNAILIDVSNKVIDDKYIKVNESFILDTKKLLIDNLVLPSSVVFRKKLLGEDKAFDEFDFTSLCEDYNLWIKLSLRCEMFFLNQNLIYSRAHASWARKFEHTRQIYKNHVRLITPFLKSSDKDIREAAYTSIINNRYYGLLNLARNKKYLPLMSDFMKFVFLFKDPRYWSAFLKRIKLKFQK